MLSERMQCETVTGVKAGGQELNWPTDTIVYGYKRNVMWGKGLSPLSWVMMTPPEVLVARGGGKIFVTPQGITSYSENLFVCGSARGMTDHFFSTLRRCNTTLIIETDCQWSSADGPSSLNFALQVAGDQLCAEVDKYLVTNEVSFQELYQKR